MTTPPTPTSSRTQWQTILLRRRQHAQMYVCAQNLSTRLPVARNDAGGVAQHVVRNVLLPILYACCVCVFASVAVALTLPYTQRAVRCDTHRSVSRACVHMCIAACAHAREHRPCAHTTWERGRSCTWGVALCKIRISGAAVVATDERGRCWRPVFGRLRSRPCAVCVYIITCC